MQEPARSTGSAQVIPGRSPGRADDFDYAASMARPLPWTLEETILAGWAAARNEWRGVNMTSRVVQDLSQICVLNLGKGERRGDTSTTCSCAP